jgi:hypothetical protein
MSEDLVLTSPFDDFSFSYSLMIVSFIKGTSIFYSSIYLYSLLDFFIIAELIKINYA